VKVSVCIPTFNSADTLEYAIQSVLSQRFGDYELIISDNASTDDTVDRVARYRDQRIRYWRHASNLGYTRNVRSMIERASGDLMVILCGDDYWCGEFLEEGVRAFGRSPKTTLVYAAYRTLEEDLSGEKRLYPAMDIHRPAMCDGPRYVRDEFMRPYAILAGTLFRRSLALVRDSFGDPSLRFLPDFVHRLRVGSEGDVAYLEEPLAVYRRHEGSITAHHTLREWIEEEIRVVEILVRDRWLYNTGLDRLHHSRLRLLWWSCLRRILSLRAAGNSPSALRELFQYLGSWGPSGWRSDFPLVLGRITSLLPPPLVREILRRGGRPRKVRSRAPLIQMPLPIRVGIPGEMGD
jgi:glycosyltransferase involved in cell wall biosynthesis